MVCALALLLTCEDDAREQRKYRRDCVMSNNHHYMSLGFEAHAPSIMILSHLLTARPQKLIMVIVHRTVADEIERIPISSGDCDMEQRNNNNQPEEDGREPRIGRHCRRYFTVAPLRTMSRRFMRDGRRRRR